MLRILWCFLLLLLISFGSNAQLVPISLEQRVTNSDVVFEGKVIAKSAAWDRGRHHIYTTNIITVYKVFKGKIANSTVELVTIGGTVGNEREDVSYGLKLEEGSVGVFTCIPSTANLKSSSSSTKLKAYSEIQGFIQYDLKTGSARDVFKVYKNISKEVYASVEKITHSKFQVVKKADFKIQ